ncbi:MAG: spermidine/putrescine transport system substrate-binding protein [Halovenus sp.]|jgi:spermidine/putrescine transport system substrate-binding protein
MVNHKGVPSGERGQVTGDNREQTNSSERVTGGEASATTSRRAFLAASGTGAALAMAGCLGGGSGTLTVSTWSGTNVEVFRETIKPMYEDQTGNDVEIVGNWENILGKVRQSPSDDPPFDLTVGSNRDHYLGDQDDLWEPIRYENVPNAETVKETLENNLESDRGVPVAYGVMGYAYDADAVEFQLDSWRDAAVQDVDMNLALPGSYFFNTVIMGAIATEAAPMEQELYDDSQRDMIFETLREMPIEKFYSGAQDLWTSMSQGVTDVGQYFYAYSRKRDQTGDMNIGIRVPDRTMGYVDHYQVARGSSNRQSAEEFINFLLQDDVQTAYADAFNLGMASTEATHPEATRAEVPIENAELEENTVFKQYSQVAESAADLNERFTEFQTEF